MLNRIKWWSIFISKSSKVNFTVKSLCSAKTLLAIFIAITQEEKGRLWPYSELGETWYGHLSCRFKNKLKDRHGCTMQPDWLVEPNKCKAIIVVGNEMEDLGSVTFFWWSYQGYHSPDCKLPCYIYQVFDKITMYMKSWVLNTACVLLTCTAFLRAPVEHVDSWLWLRWDPAI